MRRLSTIFLIFVLSAVTPAQAVVQDGDVVKGKKAFSIAVPGSSYDYFDIGRVCISVDGISITKYNIANVTLGNVEYVNFGSGSDFNLSSKGCTSNLWMEEDVQSFDSVDFTLDTALLSNGKHEIEVTIENDSSTCSGECIPDSVTTFSFTASNKSLLPPKIYFNPEIWNCADCMAIGIPYTLTATFGSSALGAPKEVSLHTKVNGVWGKHSSAKFKNKKWVFPPITMNANTWIEVKAKFGTRNWYYKQLLKPARRMTVSSPSEVRVGKSGTATVKLPGVNYSRCVVIQRFYADYGAGSVKQYAGSMSGGKIFVSARYSSSGTLDGTVACRVNGEEISASFGWDVTYW